VIAVEAFDYLYKSSETKEIMVRQIYKVKQEKRNATRRPQLQITRTKTSIDTPERDRKTS
jgi:hypothetical protein